MLPLLLSLVTLGIGPAAQTPAPNDHQRMLDTARELALQANNSLPDFICSEAVQRTIVVGSVNHTLTDRLTIAVTYFGQKEQYKLVAINGAKTEQPLESLAGIITGGEFGSVLLRLFDAAAKADFQWKRSATVRGQNTAVYAFRVARANSRYVLGYRNDKGDALHATAGYHGEIYLDSANRVIRLTNTADDIPKDSGIFESSMQVDYDFVDIGGQRYLLPTRAENRMNGMYQIQSNVITFSGYHKFEATSTIDFGKPGL
jgi:hypothetical protein